VTSSWSFILQLWRILLLRKWRKYQWKYIFCLIREDCEKKKVHKENHRGKNFLRKIGKRNVKCIDHISCRNSNLPQVINGKIEGETEVKWRRGRRCRQILDNIERVWGNWKLEQEQEQEQEPALYRLHPVEGSSWKTLWTCRNTNCGMAIETMITNTCKNKWFCGLLILKIYLRFVLWNNTVGYTRRMTSGYRVEKGKMIIWIYLFLGKASRSVIHVI